MTLSSDDAGFLASQVRDAIDAFDKEARKSPELAEREAKLETEAFGAWKEARAGELSPPESEL